MDTKFVAAQLYTLRDYLKTPEDIENTLKKVKEMGYSSVQVSGMGTIDPVRLKRITDDLGLTICITHTPADRLKNDLNAVIKEHKLWNCEYVGLGCMPGEYSRSREGYSAFARDFSVIAGKLAENGLKFAYHNHRFEFEKFDGVTGMDILFNESDPDTFGFEIDTYWVQAGGADPVEWIKKVKGRMGVIHLKDMVIKNNEQIYAEVGEGNLNWGSILKACRDTGVKWYAVEQDECQRDPFESISISLRNLKNM